MKKVALTALAIGAFVAACSKSDSKPAGEAPTPSPTGDRVLISVTDKGFEPDNVAVPSGKPVTLVFTRKSDTTCAKEVVIPLDGQTIEKKLPLNEPVEVAVTFPKAGQITYACGMDMLKGVVVVQ